MTVHRPTSVAAGQADGLMPRTIEVLQVVHFNPHLLDGMR